MIVSSSLGRLYGLALISLGANCNETRRLGKRNRVTNLNQSLCSAALIAVRVWSTCCGDDFLRRAPPILGAAADL
jgi:hypothetical protein